MVVLQTIAPRMGWDLSKLSASEIEELLTICQDFWREAASEKDQKLSLLRTMVRHALVLEEDLKGYAWSVFRTNEPRLLIGDAPILAISGHERGWHGLIPKGRQSFSQSPQTRFSSVNRMRLAALTLVMTSQQP